MTAAVFYSIGKFFELSYGIKKPSGQDRTAAAVNSACGILRLKTKKAGCCAIYTKKYFIIVIFNTLF